MPIATQFQQILGRAPTQAELAYLGKFMAEGSLQEHEIGQILQGTPEYQQSQLNRDTEAYGQKLQANDNQVLQQGADIAGAQAQSRFAGLGRPNSSALAASVFGQQGQLAQSRQSALADFYGRGLQNNAGLYAQRGQSALDRGYGLRDETRQRGYQMEDYYRQQNDFNTSLNAANRQRKQQGFAQFGGGLAGGLAGAYMGGPAGAKVGAGVGSQFGGLF